MFKIFRSNDEFESKLVKQCPSCNGFVKSSEAKCRHCGKSTQKQPLTPPQYNELEERPNPESNSFVIQ